jgi:hypothetical protein
MNSKEKKNYNQFYMDMMTLIETHIEKVPPHEVGYSMIMAATTMMLENASSPVSILKLCNSAINSGVDEWEEESTEHDTPVLWDKE